MASKGEQDHAQRAVLETRLAQIRDLKAQIIARQSQVGKHELAFQNGSTNAREGIDVEDRRAFFSSLAKDIKAKREVFKNTERHCDNKKISPPGASMQRPANMIRLNQDSRTSSWSVLSNTDENEDEMDSSMEASECAAYSQAGREGYADVYYLRGMVGTALRRRIAQKLSSIDEQMHQTAKSPRLGLRR